MAEKSVSRESAIQHGVQRGELINPFAGKNTFAEQILICVRDGACVNIEPALAGENRSQARARSGSNSDANARLQDAEPTCDDTQLWIDHGPIQRMRNGANQACGLATRELCIGVDGQDITNFLEYAYGTSLDGKR